jgi:hypothetical protein
MKEIMVTEEMPRQQKRTNIYIPDEETWAWAQYRAKILGYETTSDYLFDLIKFDKQNNILKKK